MASSVMEFQHKQTISGEEQIATEVNIVASSWIHGNNELCWWRGSQDRSTDGRKTKWQSVTLLNGMPTRSNPNILITDSLFFEHKAL